MIAMLIANLRKLPDATLQPGIDLALLNRYEEEHKLYLPQAHKEVLSLTNGIDTCDGYCCLFGFYRVEGIDAVRWNEDACWKFAWEGRASDFFCFGQLADGSQYAYLRDDLKKGKSPTVYEVYPYGFGADALCPFEQFFVDYFVPWASYLFDSKLREARQKFGPLRSTQQLILSPPLLFGRVMEVERLQILDAVTAMIFRADAGTQLNAGPPDEDVKGVETYVDEKGRNRLRLLWTEKPEKNQNRKKGKKKR